MTSRASSSPLTKLLQAPEGHRKIGSFRLVRQLGKGGFAPVWLASEVFGGAELRTVALKLFALYDDDEVDLGATARKARRDMILSEARALCRVEHPNVVRFYALAVDDPGDVLGLAMEYVRGTSLDVKLTRSAKLPVAETLAVGAAIASALAAVHAVGLVHRDVKPANVIDAAGIYKLIDFGIAAAGRGQPSPVPRSFGEPATVVLDDLPLDMGTQTRARVLAHAETALAPRGPGRPARVPHPTSSGIAGTLGYMDPTTLSTTMRASAGSDLYSLGALLFECLTGLVPAVAASQRSGASGPKPEVLDGRERAPRVKDLATFTPDALARLVDALLDPDPKKRPRSAEVVAWELERVRRDLAGRSRPLPAAGPFRGLGRFEERDRDVYFGRSVDIAAGLEMLRARGLVALIGPSGSGKSSLARAGIVPAVLEGELGVWPKTWESAIVVPGQDPRAALAQVLAPYARTEVAAFGAMAPAEAVAALADAVAQEERGLVLLVDQLEELVTLSSGEGQSWAGDLLARMGAEALPGLRCVVTLRRDLVGALLGLKELGKVTARSALLVAPLGDEAWDEVILRALTAYGYRLEDDTLHERLAQELRSAGAAMPLVQFALTQLWERRDEAKKIIPRAALDAIGGVAGALERHANATLDLVAHEDATAVVAAERVLVAMTTPQGTRRAEPRAELLALHAVAGRVLERLETARLVVAEPDGLTIAHEALLVQWKRLRRWIEAAREDRVLAEAIEREAKEWEETREPERLWKGRRLTAARELARKSGVELDASARAFILASERAWRKGRVVAGVLGLAVVASLAGLAVYSYAKARVAEDALSAASLAADQANASRDLAVRLEEIAEEGRAEAVSRKEEAEQSTQRAEAEKRRADGAVATMKELTAKVAKARTQRELEEAQTRLKAALRGEGGEPAGSVAKVRAPDAPWTAAPATSRPPSREETGERPGEIP